MNQLRHWVAFAMLFVVMGAQAQVAIADDVLWYKNNLAKGTILAFQSADLTLFDGFNNGNPTLSDPQAGNVFYNYSLQQALKSPVETGGYLTITASPVTAAISYSANGLAYYSVGVRLETNIIPTTLNAAGKVAGLGKDTAWSIAASFVPLVPLPGDNYQIRLDDFGIGSVATQGTDVLALQVYGTTQGPRLRLVKQNFSAGTADILWQKDISFPQAATDILLGFGHNTPNTNLINAYYGAYNNSGLISSEYIPMTSSIYSDEVLTRFQMRVSVPVPEPQTLPLWSLGLCLLVLARKRLIVCNGRHGCAVTD